MSYTAKTYQERKAWNDTMKAAGLDAVNLDTSARLTAIMYVFQSAREQAARSGRLRADMEWIQDKYDIYGGCKDAAFLRLYAMYVAELTSGSEFSSGWAKAMMERYGVEIK